MKQDPFVYLDNGATSFPKPKATYQATLYSMLYNGGNAGRGGHRLAIAASRDVYRLRETASDFFGSQIPENVIICHNTTHALNLAIKSVADKNDTFVFSDLEHNSVRRTINSLSLSHGVKEICFKTYSDESQTMLSVVNCCERNKPKALVCLHNSNICQRKLPIQQIGNYCNSKGIFFIVDGAQSGGHEIINLNEYKIDALCLPGHKGLLGPMGVGLLIISPKFAEYISSRPTLLEGGSGVDSSSLTMPSVFPERLEAGTVPSPLCAGLEASIKYIESLGIDCIKSKELALYRAFMNILSDNKKVTVYLPEYRAGNVISFNVNGMTPWQTAEYFDKQGICTRAGLHCSPLAHKTLGTFDLGGTVRISFGIFNNQNDINAFYKALKNLTFNCK